MTGLMWVGAAVLIVGVAAIVIRRRRTALREDSAYGRWQREQKVLWHGRPVTVVFDYAPYLQEPQRRKVNVHTLQESAMGERTVVGFCHDGREDRSFKLSSIQGAVLVERSKEEMAVDDWLQQLSADALSD